MQDGLFSSDPMEVYEACNRLTQADADRPGVVDRLLELLGDDRDADCGHLPCAAAVDALARLDRSGRWMERAGAAFRGHIERDDYDQARAIAAAVRRSVPAGEYLAWSWRALGERTAQYGGRAATAVACLDGWESDGDIVAELLALDEGSRVWVLRHLLTAEAVLHHMLMSEPRPGPARSRWEADLAAISRWTADAPESLREEVNARARETGLN